MFFLFSCCAIYAIMRNHYAIMNTTDLKLWLKDTGYTRQWLADKCGASKRTVDGWFSRKIIPPTAQAVIVNVIETETIPTIRFTFAEWKQVHEAMVIAGFDNYEEFLITALREQAQRLIQQEKDLESQSDSDREIEEMLKDYQEKNCINKSQTKSG